MTRTTFCFTFAFAGLLSLAALGIGAAVDMPATLMSRGDYEAALRVIEAETRLGMAQCRLARGMERSICKAEVRSGQRVAVADLKARYHGTVGAAEDARLARARAGYDVARARCDFDASAQRLECLRAAREEMRQSVALAKLATT